MCAPAAASSVAIALPMPVPPPVTIATFPCRSMARSFCNENDICPAHYAAPDAGVKRRPTRRKGPHPWRASPTQSTGSGRATSPDPRCGDLEGCEGPAWSEIQGPKVRSAKGQVPHHLWRLDDAEDVTGGRDHPDAAGAHAPHPPRDIDFEAIRDTGSRGGHLAEHPIMT